MLLSLLKILFFFAVILAISLGAMQLAETGQMLRIEYGGMEFALTPVKAVVALLVLMVGAWLLLRLLGLIISVLRFLAGDETAINRHFARSRERKGYDALSEGMLAVASGEGKLAQDKAAKAEKYLDRPHITNLLAAQAAEVAGDNGRADTAYRKLLDDERTRFVGIRGLMRQRLEKGDTATALLLAQKAYALKPSHKELQDTLLGLQTRQHEWKGARAVLRDKSRQGDLPKNVHLRRDAVLALQEAREVLAEGSSISAREAAISANRASPDLIPAAVLAARSYADQKDFRNASRILEKSWSVNPHPDLAAAYAEIVPDETPQARLKRFDRLVSSNADHVESRLLKAELLLAAEDFPGARRALGDLAETQPTVRTLSIMAAIERGAGAEDHVVRGWLARALTASRGPQWVCDKCHNVMSDWSPVCDSCGGFDTLTWRVPDERRSAAPVGTGAEMLPLLVGSPRDNVPETREAADVTPPPAHEVKLNGRSPVSTDKKDPTPNVERMGNSDAETKGAVHGDDADAVPDLTTNPEPGVQRTKIIVPDVAPGMVPRESDYIEIEPARTVTTAEPVPVRPDVEPADEADWTETPPRRKP